MTDPCLATSQSTLREFLLALLEACETGASPGNGPLAGPQPAVTREQLAASGGHIADYIPLYRQYITTLSEQANREGDLPPMSKDEVDMLCFCVITCRTLRDVIARASRFVAMLGGRAAVLTLEVHDHEAHFHMTTQRVRTSVSALLTDLFGLAFYRRLFSWLIGENIPVSSYCVLEAEVMDRGLLERVFQQSIHFDQDDNSFSFPARLLNKPVMRSPAALEEVLSVLPFDQMFDPGEHWQFSNTVASIIHTQLARNGRIPNLQQIASFINTSPATLHRRLVLEGTSYAAIKQAQRRNHALELLAQEDMKMDAIAASLDFSDTRSFRRAFITWTGLTPQAWRADKAHRQA